MKLNLISKFLEFFNLDIKSNNTKLIRNIKAIISEQYPNYYKKCINNGKKIDNIIYSLINIYDFNKVKEMFDNEKNKEIYKLKAKVVFFTGNTFDEIKELLGDNCEVNTNNGQLIVKNNGKEKILEMNNSYLICYFNGDVNVFNKKDFESFYECVTENESPVKQKEKILNPLLIPATAKPLS